MSASITKYVKEYLDDEGYSYNDDVDKPFNLKAERRGCTIYIKMTDSYNHSHREMVKAHKQLKLNIEEGVDFKVWLISNFNGNGLNLYEYKEDRYTFTLCNFRLKPRSNFKRIFKLTAY